MSKDTPPPPEYIQPPAYDPYNIDFKFMVFQGNPKLDSIYFWLDGDRSKHKMMRGVFLKLVAMINEELGAKAYEACNTYSFYLWNKEGKTISHLMPKGTKDDPYPDSIMNVIQGKAVPTQRGAKGVSRTLEETLAGYGFNTPTDGSMSNLQFSMTPNKPAKEDRFSMIKNLLKGRRY
jgi:hypothetical protein